MKSKILKIMLGLILFSALLITVSLAATTVKENVEDFDDIIYVIGSTRFNSDVVITAEKAANAGVNEAKLYVALGKTDEIENLNLKTYCYNPFFNEWYEIKEKAQTLNEEEAEKIEENLNIFFINNEEKTLEFNYTANKDDVNVITEGVTFDGTKFTVPATKFRFEFKENNTKIAVQTEKTTENEEEVLDYGNFYIPLVVSYYDKIGGTKLGETQTDKNNKIITTKLFNYEKFAEELTYTDEDGIEVDFSKPITKSENIYQKWLPVGVLANENGVFENKTLTYNGTALLNTDNKNEITVKVYAPKDYDTSETKIEGLTEKFDDVKVLDTELGAYYVELPVVFENKIDKKDINITWKQGVTSKLQVVLGKNAKFEYLVTYHGYSFSKTKLEKVLEGDKIVGPDTKPSKSNNEFIGWTLNEGTLEVFDGIVKQNIDLYPAYRKLPVYDQVNVKNLKLGEEREFVIYIMPGDYTGKTITVTGDITATAKKTVDGETVITPIKYDENNYFEAWNGSEWVRFENYTLTLDANKENNAIKIRQKLTDGFNSKDNYYNYYTVKEGERVLYCMGGSKTVLAEQDILATANGQYLCNKDILYALHYTNIKLEQDVTITSRMTQTTNDKNITLDLNGHTLTGNFSKAHNMIILQSNNTNLTIKNGTIKTMGQTMAAIAIGSDKKEYNSTVTLEKDAKILVENDNGGGVTIFGKGPVFNLNGEIELLGTGYGISGNGSTKDQNTTVNINEGSKITANKAVALYLPQMGTVNINGGIIKANTVASIKSGTLNIKGGVLTAIGVKVKASNLTPTSNGSNLTGDVVFAEVNSNYAGNIIINYTAGTMKCASEEDEEVLRVYGTNPSAATVTGLKTVGLDENIHTYIIPQGN